MENLNNQFIYFIYLWVKIWCGWVTSALADSETISFLNLLHLIIKQQHYYSNAPFTHAIQTDATGTILRWLLNTDNTYVIIRCISVLWYTLIVLRKISSHLTWLLSCFYRVRGLRNTWIIVKYCGYNGWSVTLITLWRWNIFVVINTSFEGSTYLPIRLFGNKSPLEVYNICW